MKRFKASYYGFLIGDAMGVPVEFCKREDLLKNPVTKMYGSETYNIPAGSWSDDGSMMMAEMDSICACNGIDYKDMADKFSQWISYGQYTATGDVFDVGRATLKAIERYQSGLKPLEAGMEGVNYNGNGSLMRMVPIAFYAYRMKLSSAEIVDLVCDVSSLTHRHEFSFLGCYIFVRYMIYLLEGYDRDTCYQKIREIDYSDFDLESVSEYKRILNDEIYNYPLSEISSSGYVVDTLEAVLWCVNNTDSFEQAIIGAVNLGDDTDTIGALVGSLAGIIYGYHKIPRKWINTLQKKDYVKAMCTSFIKCLNNLG